jgi:hypothetical protein
MHATTSWFASKVTYSLLGCVSLHPTYKKMVKVFLEKPGFLIAKKPASLEKPVFFSQPI